MLVCWNVNEERCSALAETCRKVLCRPTTSISSERIFSNGGLVCNKNRAKSPAGDLNLQVFLNKNATESMLLI